MAAAGTGVHLWSAGHREKPEDGILRNVRAICCCKENISHLKNPVLQKAETHLLTKINASFFFRTTLFAFKKC